MNPPRRFPIRGQLLVTLLRRARHFCSRGLQPAVFGFKVRTRHPGREDSHASGEFPDARGPKRLSDLIHFRLDDLRRHAAELASGVGVAPAQGAALASHLLWFDAVGASEFGIATLPRWLERISVREFDVVAEGKVMTERNGTAVLDGQNGLPPLVLEHAAGIAAEKAREAGVGVVRVTPLGPMGPTASVAAELAIGPFLAAIMGPGPSWSLALPSNEGLPVVFDSVLDGGPSAGIRSEPPQWASAWLRGPRWLPPGAAA